MIWLLRLLRLLPPPPPPPPPRPACRMSEAEVLRLARTVINEFGGLAAHPKQRDGRVEWYVAQVVMGTAEFVRIDDATGAIIEGGWSGAR